MDYNVQIFQVLLLCLLIYPLKKVQILKCLTSSYVEEKSKCSNSHKVTHFVVFIIEFIAICINSLVYFW